jgi:hypothetical protein
MICPLCHSQMIKVRTRPGQSEPSEIRCVDCRFFIFYRGIKPAA